MRVPNFNKTHHIYVKAPNGDYASYCGTWYDKETDYAYIEPVCTDPLYRKKGCAKAAVYEAIKRCGELGAKRAYVISSQQFYYNIGFYPQETYTVACRLELIVIYWIPFVINCIKTIEITYERNKNL